MKTTNKKLYAHSAMEQRPFQKRASLKSHMSKGKVCLLTAMLLGAGSVMAATSYTLTGTAPNKTLTITGTGAMTNYSKGDGTPWYSSRTDIATLVISEGVTSIGEYAFSDCSGLTSVTIPNSATSIGERAFYDCSGLTAIDVSTDNVAYASEDGVLFNKTKTTLILYPNGKTRAYTIPSSVTSIGSQAFSGCSGLTSITIPSSATSIGSYAFYGCSGLTAVTIPSSVTSIGQQAFSYCSGLTSVPIDSGVTSIGDYAFEYCSGLTSVTIPNSVTSIGGNAFSNCRGLTGALTIPSSVTSIGSGAFNGCSGLTSVTIPSSVTSIGEWAFYDCSGLTAINVNAANTAYVSEDGVLFNKNKTTLVALKFTVLRPLQLEKAFCPMLVTLLGMVTEVRPLQPEKAELTMLVTLLGIVKEVRPLQL
jgi:hypothetical protein